MYTYKTVIIRIIINIIAATWNIDYCGCCCCCYARQLLLCKMFIAPPHIPYMYYVVNSDYLGLVYAACDLEQYVLTLRKLINLRTAKRYHNKIYPSPLRAIKINMRNL